MGLSPVYEPQKLHSVAGTVLDSARLYQGMSLYENLRFFAGLHGLDENDALERSSFPVSYTHLDVYKRQRQSRAKGETPRLRKVRAPQGKDNG